MVEIWKTLSPDFLEPTLIFLKYFSRFFQIFKIWIQKSPISNLGPDRSQWILENMAEFFNHDCG
jgi:hypothetical protein